VAGIFFRASCACTGGPVKNTCAFAQRKAGLVLSIAPTRNSAANLLGALIPVFSSYLVSMKKTLSLFVGLGLLFATSCARYTDASLHPVNGKQIDVASRSVSEFVFVGTLGISGKPNVLYSDLLKVAKEKYGEDITLSNMRIQNIRQGFTRRQEVLVDVYKVKL